MIINVDFQIGKVINGFYRIIDYNASINTLGDWDERILEEAILDHLKSQFQGYDVWICLIDYAR